MKYDMIIYNLTKQELDIINEKIIAVIGAYGTRIRETNSEDCYKKVI